MAVTADTLAELTSIRTIELTTIGRRSQEPHTLEIWWFHIDGRFIITGTPGRRDWYANILSDPGIVITTSIGSFTATAVPIVDSGFRRTVFTERSSNWYSTQAELDELIRTSPMVEIQLRLD
jgi:hypothetical protein